MGGWLSRLCFSIPPSWGGKHVCLCIKCLVRKGKLYLVIGHFEGAQGGKVADTDTSVCFLCAGFARVHAPVPGLFSQVRKNNRSNYKLSKQSWTTRRVSKNNSPTHVSPAMNFKQISLSSLSSVLLYLPPTLNSSRLYPSSPFLSPSPLICSTFYSLSVFFCFSGLTGTQWEVHRAAPQGAPEGAHWLTVSWMRSRSPHQARLLAVGPPRVMAALEAAQVYAFC